MLALARSSPTTLVNGNGLRAAHAGQRTGVDSPFIRVPFHLALRTAASRYVALKATFTTYRLGGPNAERAFTPGRNLLKSERFFGLCRVRVSCTSGMAQLPHDFECKRRLQK
jgi:hypothetical protein